MLHTELSYIAGPVEKSVPYTTIPNIFKERSEKQPDDEAFIFYTIDGQRKSLSFGNLYEKSQLFASSLISLGIKKNDRIIMYSLCNTEEWLIAEFGIILTGAIPVNCFVILEDGSDMDYVMKKTHPVAVIFSVGHAKRAVAAKRLLQTGDYPFVKHIITLDSDDDMDGYIPFSELMKKSDAHSPLPSIYIDPDDLLVIYRSSGTTGRPKLVSHSHCSIIRTCTLDNEPLLESKMFTNAGFSWLGGSTFPDIINGTSRVTLAGDISSLGLRDILKFVENEKCSILSLTTDLTNRIIFENLPLPLCVTLVTLGGCPIQKNKVKLLETSKALRCGYGSLEAGRIAAVIVRKGCTLEDNIGGYPMSGVEVKIVNDLNEVVRRESTGRIFVRTKSRFLGYYGEKELTDKTVTRANWIDTHDVGYITKTGKLFVIGRLEEGIKRGAGGTKHTSEIEKVIKDLEIADIHNLVVVPVPDIINNQEICLCVILKSGRHVTEDDLLILVQKKIINPFYRPKYVVCVDSFPVNVNGKVDRKELTKSVLEYLQLE